MAEKEYIEREAAIEKLNKLCDRVCQYSKAQRKYMCGACPLGDAFTVIEDDLPAADVRPVVKAHFKLVDGYSITALGYDIKGLECSNCGATFIAQSWVKRFNFCPNCGARMEEQNG